MIASDFVGYLEHKSPDRLNEFTENVGKGGCTIFASMIMKSQKVNLMHLPWCSTFVHAIINRPDILGKAHPGCRVLVRRMKHKKLWVDTDYIPTVGDLVFYANNKRIDHVGIVEYCDGKMILSIEGNAIDDTGHFKSTEGGIVAKRIRSLTDPKIKGYAKIGGLINYG